MLVQMPKLFINVVVAAFLEILRLLSLTSCRSSWPM